MSPEDTVGWSLEFEATRESVPVFLNALAGLAAAVSSFEAGPGGPWRIEAWFSEMPDHGALAASVALAAAAASVREPDFVVRPVAARDWLAENRASFRPVKAGRFFVHPSFHEGLPPAGALSVALDAATAFGSGAHGTTQGCLLALNGLARHLRPRRILDMGCGSGILAIAMAKAWRRPVLAVDIDAEAVRVTRGNARANGVARLVQVGEGAGFAAPVLHGRGRFDLIAANILAKPLERMAPALARRLAPGGVAVLSGMLAHQEPRVIAACRAQGLRLIRRIRIETWSTLVLMRGSRSPQAKTGCARCISARPSAGRRRAAGCSSHRPMPVAVTMSILRLPAATVPVPLRRPGPVLPDRPAQGRPTPAAPPVCGSTTRYGSLPPSWPA